VAADRLKKKIKNYLAMAKISAPGKFSAPQIILFTDLIDFK